MRIAGNHYERDGYLQKREGSFVVDVIFGALPFPWGGRALSSQSDSRRCVFVETIWLFLPKRPKAGLSLYLLVCLLLSNLWKS